jgi:chromosome segregation ATPase
MNETTGMPFWLFWLMLAVILFLIAVLLIRDKGIRDGIKRIFFRIGRKIQDAKIKLKIGKEKERVAALLVELGRKMLALDIHPRGMTAVEENLHRLHSEQDHLDRSIEILQQKIDETARAYERLKTDRELDIKKQEELKAQEVNQLDRLKKVLGDIEKTAAETVKLRARNEKKMAACKKKIDEIKADNDLSKIEKQTKTEELDAQVKTLEQEIRQLTERLDPLYREKGSPEKEIQRIRPVIAGYDEKIRALKEELKTREKEYAARNREQLKEKGELVGKKNQLQRQAEQLFEKLGAAGNEERQEHEALSTLYSDIDRSRDLIKRLEKQLSA